MGESELVEKLKFAICGRKKKSDHSLDSRSTLGFIQFSLFERGHCEFETIKSIALIYIKEERKNNEHTVLQ